MRVFEGVVSPTRFEKFIFPLVGTVVGAIWGYLTARYCLQQGQVSDPAYLLMGVCAGSMVGIWSLGGTLEYAKVSTAFDSMTKVNVWMRAGVAVAILCAWLFVSYWIIDKVYPQIFGQTEPLVQVVWSLGVYYCFTWLCFNGWQYVRGKFTWRRAIGSLLGVLLAPLAKLYPKTPMAVRCRALLGVPIDEP